MTAPLFLVGPQRSGTTALGMALSAAIAASGGCFTVNGKLPYLLRRWWTGADIAAGHARSDEVAYALARMPILGTGADAWLGRANQALQAGARRATGEAGSAIGEVRQICAEAYGTGPWGDKYNEYLLDLPWLDAVFPEARWIFLVRDPGRTVASMLAWQAKPWNPGDARAASAKWAHWASRWLDFRERIAPERRLELDYDGICRGRHFEISAFAGVEVAPFLAGFQHRSPAPPAAALGARARRVHARLAALDILAPAGQLGCS